MMASCRIAPDLSYEFNCFFVDLLIILAMNDIVILHAGPVPIITNDIFQLTKKEMIIVETNVESPLKQYTCPAGWPAGLPG